MSNVFLCWGTCATYSPDEKYMLKAGSPALNAGQNGYDCGVFDGLVPYQLSGLYGYPAIWYYDVSGSYITLKVKSH
jgi:hypothetical protein